MEESAKAQVNGDYTVMTTANAAAAVQHRRAQGR
jgi:hypothetical protein